MALSGAEYSMAVMATFPLSLVVILSSIPFSINIDILGFFQNCSYTALALSFRGTSDMPRTELSSAMSQDYLDFYYTSSAIPLLGSSLGPQYKNGPGPQILGPHNNHKEEGESSKEEYFCPKNMSSFLLTLGRKLFGE